jgi:tRNA1(Val) A37 N6-methylase TrmN6
VASGSVTHDTLLDGAVPFTQPRSGYRVNADAVLLAAFARCGRRARLCVDLGAGVGAVSLMLGHYDAAQNVALVERDPVLAELARENLVRCSLRGSVTTCDLELAGLPRALVGAAELVVSNPPFFEEGEHRAPRSAAKRGARLGSVVPFLKAAARALEGGKARAAFVYPARALAELFDAAGQQGLVPKRLCLVHAFRDKPARVALVEFKKARPGGLVVEPPLVEWERPRESTREIRRFVAPGR